MRYDPRIDAFRLSLEAATACPSMIVNIEVFVHILHEIHTLGGLLQSAETSDAHKMTQHSYSDKVEAVERWIILLLQVDKPVPQCFEHPLTIQQLSFVKAFAYTSYLYSIFILRDLPRALRLFDRIAERLRIVLETAELEVGFPDFYLTALLMGRASAVSTDLKAWYASQLQSTCYVRGLHNPQSIRCAVRNIFSLQMFWNVVVPHLPESVLLKMK